MWGDVAGANHLTRWPQRRYDGSAESQPSSVASAMNVVEKVFAAAMVVVCVVLLLRMVLRPRRRARVDASVRKQAAVWRSRVVRVALWPAAELRARRETREAIRRAKRSAVEREGNVISPKAFKGRRRDLH